MIFIIQERKLEGELIVVLTQERTISQTGGRQKRTIPDKVGQLVGLLERMR